MHSTFMSYCAQKMTNSVMFVLLHQKAGFFCNTRTETVETTLIISRFHFLKFGSRISELDVNILSGMQILKVISRISY